MAKRRTQRDIIRELYAKHGRDVDRVLKGVEKAIKWGEFRHTTTQNQTLRYYVSHLLEQGLAQRGKSTGWLLE